VNLRIATENDATEISSLILTVAHSQLRTEFSEDGWLLFKKLLAVKTLKGLLNNKKFFYLVVTKGQSVVGVLCIKDRSHVFHFFVHSEFQGRGIGKLLWKAYLNDIKKPRFNYGTPVKKFTEVSVNSSDYALPIYQKLGFKMKNGRQIKNGVCYTPLTFALI